MWYEILSKPFMLENKFFELFLVEKFCKSFWYDGEILKNLLLGNSLKS